MQKKKNKSCVLVKGTEHFGYICSKQGRSEQIQCIKSKQKQIKIQNDDGHLTEVCSDRFNQHTNENVSQEIDQCPCVYQSLKTLLFFGIKSLTV